MQFFIGVFCLGLLFCYVGGAGVGVGGVGREGVCGEGGVLFVIFLLSVNGTW